MPILQYVCKRLMFAVLAFAFAAFIVPHQANALHSRADIFSLKERIESRVCDRLGDLFSRFPLSARMPSFCKSEPPPPPVVELTLTADPGSISLGDSSTLMWNSTDADSCEASGGWAGSKALSGSEEVMPAVTTTYTITCSNTGGFTAESATITVVEPLPVTVSLTADPDLLAEGATSTLAWTAENADTCSASGDWSGSKPLSGLEMVAPVATSTYVLSCSGAGGTAEASTTIGVMPTSPPPPIPTVSIHADPSHIVEGATTTLTWSSTDATSCLASNGWLGAKTISGSEIVSPTATTTYKLTCEGGGGMAEASTTVGVSPAPPIPALDHIVISEVYYDVDEATKGTEPAHEWVELYNPTNATISLAGWTIADATSSDVIPGGVSIAPLGFVLLTASSTLPDYWTIPQGVPIVNLGTAIGNGLGNAGESLTLSNSSAVVVDDLSWGDNESVFSPAAPDVGAGHSLARDPVDADTDSEGDWIDRENPSPGS